MEQKKYNINNSVIDPYFENINYIGKQIYDNKDIIMDNALNPKKTKNSDNNEIYYTEKLVLDNGLEIGIDSLYNNGVVYNITNDLLSENSYVPHTRAKLIVGNNKVDLFIDHLDTRYDKNKYLFQELDNNIKKETVFINALGRKINLPKLYGKKSNNRFLKILEKRQINVEKEILQSVMERSFELLKELNNEKILTKSRF